MLKQGDEKLRAKVLCKFKSNLSLYLLYYAEVRNELEGPIFTQIRRGNTAFFEEMSQRWRAVANTVSDLTDPKFELKLPVPETNELPLDQMAVSAS